MDYEADGELLKTHIDDLNSTLILGFGEFNLCSFTKWCCIFATECP